MWIRRYRPRAALTRRRWPIRCRTTGSAGRARAFECRGQAVLGDPEPAPDRDRELDRGAREVQVRAAEQPQLDEGRLAGSRGAFEGRRFASSAAALREVLGSEDIKKRFLELGVEARATSPDGGVGVRGRRDRRAHVQAGVLWSILLDMAKMQRWRRSRSAGEGTVQGVDVVGDDVDTADPGEAGADAETEPDHDPDADTETDADARTDGVDEGDTEDPEPTATVDSIADAGSSAATGNSPVV